VIRWLLAALAVLALTQPVQAQAPPVHVLVGRLVLDPVSCGHGTPTGSWVALRGAKAYRNPTPNCGNGTTTLLPPGTTGLAVGTFTADPSPVFDGRGDSRADAVVTPVAYAGHRLGLATATEDVQDAPYGPKTFPAPVALVQGSTLVVDLRSLHLTFDGYPGTTCRSAHGHGCWLVGSRSARGTWSPGTSAFTLDWTAGQGFAGPSAAAEFHLAGHFVGRVERADDVRAPGTTRALTPGGTHPAMAGARTRRTPLAASAHTPRALATAAAGSSVTGAATVAAALLLLQGVLLRREHSSSGRAGVTASAAPPGGRGGRRRGRARSGALRAPTRRTRGAG
jgi:hypothetical protein